LADTTGLSGSTHTLPPYVLARYLTLALGCEVALLGIQPAQTDLGVGLSDVVETAVTDVTATLFNLFSL
jgi:Ni,Fe-hydrogenase maturation factor